MPVGWKKLEGFKLGSLNWHTNSCPENNFFLDTVRYYLCSSRQQWNKACSCLLPFLAKNVAWLDLFPMLKSCTGKQQDNLVKTWKWKYGFQINFLPNKKKASWSKDSPVNILDVPCHWGNWRGLSLTDHGEERKFLGKTTKEKWVSRH